MKRIWLRGVVWMVVLVAVPMAHAARRVKRGQARELARRVAEYEHIDLKSPWIEFDSMDAGAPYLRDFWSFTVVREAQTPGPDTTLRRYAVSRTTGDVWEMTLCRKYDFPALAAMRKRMTGRAEATAAEDAAERKALGCGGSGSAGQQVSKSAGQRVSGFAGSR